MARIPEGAQWGYAWPEGESATYYSKDEMYGLFNESGKITEPVFTDFYNMHHGVSFVSENQGVTWYMIDAAGRRITQDTYQGGGYIQDNDLIPACRDGKWGYLRSDGSVAIDFRFDGQTFSFSQGVGQVLDPDGWYTFIDTQGNDISGGLRSGISYTAEEGFYLFRDEAGYGFYYAADANGVPVSADIPAQGRPAGEDVPPEGEEQPASGAQKPEKKSLTITSIEPKTARAGVETTFTVTLDYAIDVPRGEGDVFVNNGEEKDIFHLVEEEIPEGPAIDYPESSGTVTYSFTTTPKK